MVNCGDLIANFITNNQERKLAKSNHPVGVNGCVATNFNSLNWLSVDQVFNLILHEKHIIYKHIPIPVQILDGKMTNDEDSIYILSLDCHLYVIYRNNSDILICDGANAFLANTNNCRNKVKQSTGYLPRPIRCFGQTNVDHCGTSAVAIALEFIRLHPGN